MLVFAAKNLYFKDAVVPNTPLPTWKIHTYLLLPHLLERNETKVRHA